MEEKEGTVKTVKKKKVIVSREEIRDLEKALKILQAIAGRRIKYRTFPAIDKLPECPQLILYHAEAVEDVEEEGSKKKPMILCTTKTSLPNPETALRHIKQEIIRAIALAHIIGDFDLV